MSDRDDSADETRSPEQEAYLAVAHEVNDLLEQRQPDPYSTPDRQLRWMQVNAKLRAIGQAMLRAGYGGEPLEQPHVAQDGTVRCVVCGEEVRRGPVAWAHVNPPPTFHGADPGIPF